MNEKKHFVYKTINTLTGEYYIGKHTGYEDDDYLGSGVLLNKAINLIGEEFFKREILSFHKSSEEAYKAEKELVTKELLKDELCYNLIEGGCGFGNETKSVRQYDLDGYFIKQWESIKSAVEYLGGAVTKIPDCCKYNAKSAGGYQWFYTNEVEDVDFVGSVRRKQNSGGGNTSRVGWFKDDKWYPSSRQAFIQTNNYWESGKLGPQLIELGFTEMTEEEYEQKRY